MVTAVKEKFRIVAKEHILTDRVKGLKDTYLGVPVPQLCSERSHFLTEYFKTSEGEPILLRRANAFKNICENISIVIRDGELIAGSQTKYIRGSSAYPEFRNKWLSEDLANQASLGRAAEGKAISFIVSEEDRATLLADLEYWKGKGQQDLRLKILREKWGSVLDDASDVWLIGEANDISLARRAVDWPKVLRKGLKGIIAEAREKQEKLEIITHEDLHKKFFWEAVVISCEAVTRLARRYAALARERVKSETNAQRAKELERIAETCEYVPENPPRNFYEALQSFWFVHLAIHLENCANGYSPGRFGQHMYPFYKADIDKRILTREEAAELLACLWIKFTQMEYVRPHAFSRASMSMYQNLGIGGLTSDGKDASNELEFLLLDVTEDVRTIQPALTILLDDLTSEALSLRALEVVRTGVGMPAWFNNQYAIKTAQHFGVPLEEARGWSPHGCVEMAIPGSSVLANNAGTINLPKCLELALNNGWDPKSKKQLGPKTGDPLKFKTFNELYEAVKKQIFFTQDLAISCTNVDFATHQELAPIPFNSALTNDCVERGKDITAGGARYYNFIGFLHFGMVNTGNSLTAIKKLVFEDKAMTFKELLEALAVNFGSKEDLKRKLMAAPKYGNDDDGADEMVAQLWRLCKESGKRYKTTFGEPVCAVFHSASLHYALGIVDGALPDGRKAYTPLADGSLSPFPHTDTKGPTATVNSAVKMEPFPALSTLFNLKFHPQVLKDEASLRKLLALIKTYHEGMGYHIQFNVVSAETLLDAKKHPEQYRDLVVRVAGFSMFWVDLPDFIQDEIIERTLHSQI